MLMSEHGVDVAHDTYAESSLFKIPEWIGECPHPLSAELFTVGTCWERERVPLWGVSLLVNFF